MATLAQLSTAIEIVTKKLISIEKSVHAEAPTLDSNMFFHKVSSVENLNRLEAELQDEQNMKRYIEKFSAIYGTTGKSDGINCAYRLIDHITTQEFINKCSWTGLARETDENRPSASDDCEGGTSKIPLKFYTKFRELFLRIIRLADPDFSEASCKKFLKGVMKNSKQRLTAKVTSTHKNRPKNLKYKTDEDKNDLKE